MAVNRCGFHHLNRGKSATIPNNLSSSLLVFSSMNRSKFVAILTGVISVVLAIAYLLVVQFLDFRGEMLPAPIVEMLWLLRFGEL